MKRPVYSAAWSDDWKLLYRHDLWVLFGDRSYKSHTCMFKLRLRHTLELVRRYCDQGASILDVGAAQGTLSLVLAEAGYKVTWNDLLPDRIEYVKLKYSAGEVNYHPGNGFDLPFGRDFDCVLATEIIEHMAHPDQFPVEYVWVLNNDTLVERETLARMVTIADGDPTIGIVGSRLIDADGSGRVQALGGGRIYRWLGKTSWFVQPTTRSCDYLTGAARKPFHDPPADPREEWSDA